MKDVSRVRWMAAALVLALVAAGCINTAAPNQAASPAAPSTQTVRYPIPYTQPTTQEVIDVLERIRRRLDSGTPTAIIEHPTTRDFIPDVTPGGKPSTEPALATLDRGPEWKFSPVSYAMGVAYAGMLQASQATGDGAFDEFVEKRLDFLGANIAKVDSQSSEKQLRRNPLRSLLLPKSLDDCGAMGAAFIKARRAGVGPDLSHTIDLFARYIRHQQFRLPDGTLARKRPFADSIWGDDLYMSVPFLAQMGAMTGQSEYYDDAARQILQISQRLFVPSSGLFTHAWNTGNPDNQPRYYWGRANGWCMLAMAELLDVMPADHPDRPRILALFRAQARAVASLQSGVGLWHQMLDRNDSYLETSCSAMFTYGLARGVDQGWLDGSTYGPVALSGWQALTTRVTAAGHVEGVCIGTSYADDYVYYYARPAADDIHGYGPMLMAGSEIIHLMFNNTYEIEQNKGNPIYFLDKKRDVTTRPIP